MTPTGAPVTDATQAAQLPDGLASLGFSIAPQEFFDTIAVEVGPYQLIKAVVDDLLISREGVKALIQGAKLSEIKDGALTDLGRTAAILDAKAPADAKAFKAWLQHIAQLVAEAASEGGFSRFWRREGQVKVSDTEKATLAEISKALSLK